jgi:predicted ATPase
MDQGFWAVRRLCEGLARQRPLVLAFEDVHWAEETMLDLIEYVAETACDAPILLLCLTRPELLERRPRWGSGPGAAAIALEPLTTTETGALAASLQSDARTPPGSAQSRGRLSGKPAVRRTTGGDDHRRPLA